MFFGASSLVLGGGTVTVDSFVGGRGMLICEVFIGDILFSGPLDAAAEFTLSSDSLSIAPPLSGTLVSATSHYFCKYGCNFVIWARGFTLYASMSAVSMRVAVLRPLYYLLRLRPHPLFDRSRPRPQLLPLWYLFPYTPDLSPPSIRSLLGSIFTIMVIINVAMVGFTCRIVFATGAVRLYV